MNEFSLITAETVTVRGHPCVVLIGRDESGKKHKYRVEYRPYCYISEEDYIRLEEDDFNFKSMDIEAIGVNKRTLTKKPLTKLYFNNMDKVDSFTRAMQKYNKDGLKSPVYTYEADLAKSLLSLRYLIDKGITNGFRVNSKGDVEAIQVECNLRVWFIDFEAYSIKMCGHGPKQDEPVIMVSFYDTYENKLYTLYVNNPIWVKPVNFEAVENHTIEECKSENILLDRLMELIKEKDPDMLVGWNLDRYDIIQWKYRVDANKGKCVYEFKNISPFKSINFNSKPYRIKGRILFDLMKAFKKFTQAELRSYSLATIADIEKLGISKIPFKGSTSNTWDNNPDIMNRRNVNDVLILKALNNKYELIEMFNDLRTEYGCLFHEVLMNSRVLDTALLRYVNKRFVLRTASKGKSDGKFLGAIVVIPKVGLHEWVLQLDFTREYPNIMKLFNISPETYRKPEYKGDCYTIEYIGNTYKFIKKPIGLLPQLIDFFFKKRDEYEIEYAKAIEANDKVKIKMWWRRIFNIKGLTNAIYGVMDFPSFRLHKKECSQAVAVIGRISIEYLQNISKELGYEFIYGDTDSIFIKLQSTNKEECLKEAKCIEQKLNEGLENYFVEKFKTPTAPTELTAQKIYSRFLMLSRKNYAGKQIYDSKKGWKDSYDLKGFEAVRSDSSDLEKETLEELVKMVLEGLKTNDLINYTNLVYSGITIRDVINLAYPLQISHPIKDYFREGKDGGNITVPSHVRAALYSNTYLNTDFEEGDKPRRLPIKVSKQSKIKHGQTTLFSEDSTYPTIWKYKDREWGLRDISIEEEMNIPEWFISRIDYERIEKRLRGKVNKIIELLDI